MSNGKYLAANFVNFKFNELDKKEMEKKAHEIALFTASILDSESKIDIIAVAFTVHERKYLFVNYTNSLNTFRFKVPKLKNKKPDSLKRIKPKEQCS